MLIVVIGLSVASSSTDDGPTVGAWRGGTDKEGVAIT